MMGISAFGNRRKVPAFSVRLALLGLLYWGAPYARIYAIEPPSRSAVEKNLDQTIEKARKYINDPDMLVYFLYDNLRVAGDDPRVVAFCGEIVNKTTNPLSIHHALGTLRSISSFYSNDSKEREEIASIARKAAKKGDEMDQRDSYETLAALGGHYENEARRGYRRILLNPSLNDRRHKIICVETIQLLLHANQLDAADISAIRQATKRLDLLKVYQREMFNRDSKASDEMSQQFLDRWKAVLSTTLEVNR